MTRREGIRVAHVEHLQGALLHAEKHFTQRERLQGLHDDLIERGVGTLVEVGVVGEVRGDGRLRGGHEADDRLTIHRL